MSLTLESRSACFQARDTLASRHADLVIVEIEPGPLLVGERHESRPPYCHIYTNQWGERALDKCPDELTRLDDDSGYPVFLYDGPEQKLRELLEALVL